MAMQPFPVKSMLVTALSFAALLGTQHTQAQLLTNPLRDGTLDGKPASQSAPFQVSPNGNAADILLPDAGAPIVHSTAKTALEAFCQQLPIRGIYALRQLGQTQSSIDRVLDSPNGQATHLTMRASSCEVVQVMGKLATVRFKSPDYDWVDNQLSKTIDARLDELIAAGRLDRDTTEEEFDAIVDEILLEVMEREGSRIPTNEMTVRLKMEPYRGTWRPTSDTRYLLSSGLGLQDARTLPDH